MRILISTDGSEFSRAAIEKCCRIIVEPEKTQVKIVSVFEIVVPVDIYPAPPEFTQELENSARSQAEEFAAQAAAHLREAFPDLDLSIETIMGAPDQILIEESREWKADLIVIGTHGRGFWGRMLLGSITDSLVHHAPCSVLVVKKSNSEIIR